jgi:endonuclease/exonuclease/phosphatase (EEP) superfamily protein YafD
MRRILLVGLVALSLIYALGLAAYLPLRPYLWQRPWAVMLLNFVPWLFAPLLVLVPLALLIRSWPLRGATAVAVVVFLALYGDRFVPRLPVAQAAASDLRIMTFNVLLANRDVERIAAAIERESPDVVTLQELWPQTTERLMARLGDRFPYRALHPSRVPYGSGVLSRYPIVAEKGFIETGSEQVAHHVVLDVDGQLLNLFNIHLHQPGVGNGAGGDLLARLAPGVGRESRQSQEVDLLVQALERVDGPVVVAGDFNLTDQTPGYARLNARLRDAWREAGWGFGLTFPTVGRIRSIRIPFPLIRIDYVFHSPDLRATTAWIGQDGGSDHRYLVVDLAR